MVSWRTLVRGLRGANEEVAAEPAENRVKEVPEFSLKLKVRCFKSKVL